MSENPFAKYVGGAAPQQPVESGPQAQQSQGNENPFAKFAQVPVAQQQQQQAPKQSTFMDGVEAFNRQFSSIAEGGLQLGAKALDAVGIDTSKFQKRLQQVNQANDASLAIAEQNSPIATGVGGALGAVGATVDVGGLTGGGLLSLGRSAATNIAKSGALAGLTGAAQYADSEEERAQRALASGALGAAGQGVMQAAGGLIKSGANAIFKRPVQDAADDIAIGGSQTLGQATANEGLQNFEAGLGKMPLVGAKGNITNAVDKMQTRTGQVLEDIGVGKNTNEGLADNLKSSFMTAYKKASAVTDDAYNKALNIAKEENIAIPLNNTANVAKGALDDLNSLVKEGITSADVGNTGPVKILNDLAGKDSITSVNFEKLRKFIGGSIEDLKKSDNTNGLLPVLQKVKGSLDLDLDAQAGAVGGKFADAIKVARNTYQEVKAPFKNDAFLKKAIKEGVDPDQLLNQAVSNEKPHLTKMLMKNLTPEGQEQFSTAIVQKAVTKSTTKTGDLDLSKFTTNVHKMGETLNALPKKQQMAIKGLQKFLVRGDHLIKAAKPGTGWGTLFGLGAAAGGGGLGYAVGGIPAVITALGGTKAISSFLTNPTITKSLIKLAGGKLKSAEADATIKSTIGFVMKKMGTAIPATIGEESAPVQ